jgi:uncharacterized protein YbaP (TraB family)
MVLMKKNIFVAILFLFCGLCSVFAAEKGASALIWEVTHPAHPGKLYLAGTVHACRPDMYPLDAVYDDVLKKSDYLVFEIADLSPLAALGFMMQNGFYAPDSPEFLPDVIGKELFTGLAEEIQKSSPMMTPERAQRMKPWTFMTLLSAAFVEKHGFKTAFGMEKMIQNTPEGRQKEKRSLETVTSQLSAIAAPTLEKEIIFMLNEFRKNPETAVEELNTLIHVYRTGNEKQMQELNQKTAKETPLFYQSLIVKRNQKMSEKIFQMLAEKKIGSVRVGLAHFCGNDSIRTLLTKKGCRIVTLKYHGKAGSIGQKSTSERK